MQKIERYGVFALVFLLVTILAVSLWGESKDGGLFFWKKDGAGSDKQAQADRPRPRAPGAAQPAGAAQGQGQGPRAGALELSGDNADPVAAQLRAQRIALAQQRRAEQQAALEQQAAANGSDAAPGAGAESSPVPTPGDVALVDPFAANAGGANAPAGSTPVANTPAQGQVGAPALPVGAGPVVRPSPVNAAPLVRQNASGSRNYVVKSGDTLGEIARRELGASARWTEIAALNGNLDPKRLRTGMTLKLPAGAASSANNAAGGVAANTPSASPAAARTNSAGRSYTVKSGDTLSAIASRELGSAERWTEIVALNPRLDPARLAVGAVLALPGAAAGSNAPRQAALDERRSVAAAPRAPSKSKVQ